MSSHAAVLEEPRSAPPIAPHLIRALAHARQRALGHYQKEAARLQRGYAIALQGGVHLYGNGLAEVQSQRQPALWYPIHSRCACQDATRAPGGRCKHRWAKTLMVQALTHLAQHSGEPLTELPAPYAFPRWTRYEATYQGPESGGKPVNGIAEYLEPDLFLFRPEGKQTCWHCAYHEVALGPGIDDPEPASLWS
ncbi:MAG: hypothetical protein AB7N91_18330 [Candidatus Tectimicrobiota bacterium]